MQQRPTQQVKMNPATTITALLVQLQVIGDFVKTNTIEYMESFFFTHFADWRSSNDKNSTNSNNVNNSTPGGAREWLGTFV